MIVICDDLISWCPRRQTGMWKWHQSKLQLLADWSCCNSSNMKLTNQHFFGKLLWFFTDWNCNYNMKFTNQQFLEHFLIFLLIGTIFYFLADSSYYNSCNVKFVNQPLFCWLELQLLYTYEIHYLTLFWETSLILLWLS